MERDDRIWGVVVTGFVAALCVLPVAYLLPPREVSYASFDALGPIVKFLAVGRYDFGARADFAHSLSDRVEVFVAVESSWSRKSRRLRGSGRAGFRVRF